MNIKNKIMAGALALACLTLTAGSVQAQLVNVVSFTGTFSSQGHTNDNGKITTIAAPVKRTVTTKQLLAWLAKDEFAAGLYPSNSFPAGAVLAVVTIGGTNYFQVLDKHFDLLVDVDNVLSAGHLNNTLVSGSFSDATRLADSSVTDLRIFKFYYDDTDIENGLNVKFGTAGLESRTVKDTVPNKKTKEYTESFSIKVPVLAGEGTVQDDPVIITGSLNLAGSIVKVYP